MSVDGNILALCGIVSIPLTSHFKQESLLTGELFIVPAACCGYFSVVDARLGFFGDFVYTADPADILHLVRLSGMKVVFCSEDFHRVGNPGFGDRHGLIGVFVDLFLVSYNRGLFFPVCLRIGGGVCPVCIGFGSVGIGCSVRTAGVIRVFFLLFLGFLFLLVFNAFFQVLVYPIRLGHPDLHVVIDVAFDLHAVFQRNVYMRKADAVVKLGVAAYPLPFFVFAGEGEFHMCLGGFDILIGIKCKGNFMHLSRLKVDSGKLPGFFFLAVLFVPFKIFREIGILARFVSVKRFFIQESFAGGYRILSQAGSLCRIISGNISSLGSSVICSSPVICGCSALRRRAGILSRTAYNHLGCLIACTDILEDAVFLLDMASFKGQHTFCDHLIRIVF